jgi:hypothetical protein
MLFTLTKQNNKKMKNNFLFAIDSNKEEIIVSESKQGSNKVDFIERIGRQDNEVLFNAVFTLTSITETSNLDLMIFKSMDKVCQLIYNKHKGME